jgi:hypothetical protein
MTNKERSIDTFSKEELKDEVLFLRTYHADDQYYADEAQKEILIFQANIFVKNLMSLEDILKFNSTNTYRDSDHKVNDDLYVRQLSAMVHALVEQNESMIDNSESYDPKVAGKVLEILKEKKEASV